MANIPGGRRIYIGITIPDTGNLGSAELSDIAVDIDAALLNTFDGADLDVTVWDNADDIIADIADGEERA